MCLCNSLLLEVLYIYVVVTMRCNRHAREDGDHGLSVAKPLQVQGFDMLGRKGALVATIQNFVMLANVSHTLCVRTTFRCVRSSLQRTFCKATTLIFFMMIGMEKEKEAALDAATQRLHSVIAKTAGETASKHADIAKNCRWLQQESASLQKEIQEAIRAAEFFFEAAWAACRERCSHADRAVFLATKNRDLILQELQELKGQENQTTQHMLHLLHRVNERVHADGEERNHARNVARTLAMRVGHLEHEKRRLQSTVSDLDSSYQNLLSTAHKALDHLESPESTQGKKPSFSSVFAGRVDLSGEGFDEGTPSQNLSLSGVSFA